MKHYWTAYFPNPREKEWFIGSITANSPHKMREAYRQKRWDTRAWKLGNLQIAFVEQSQDEIQIKIFPTLAAATRFHKSLARPA